MRSFITVPLAILAVLAAVYTLDAQVTAKKFGEEHPPLAPIRLAIEVTRVVDGDTVEAQIFLPWATGASGTIRLLDLDAWESNKRRGSVDVTDEEVKKGKAAARALQECIDLGKVYAEPIGRGTHDVYGRMLARLWVKTDEGKVIDVAAWMKERGHARPDKDSQKFKPAKPVAPKNTSGNAARKLNQIASAGRGLQVPQGAGGFGGYCPLCQQTRKSLASR